jgi:60 kDa SS-A/Ro ribonucleoprotein
MVINLSAIFKGESMSYTKHFNTKTTPQTQQVPGKDQVKNNAGGFVFAQDSFSKLNRFLILGNEGGSYYASEKKMTVDNAQAVIDCIKQDGLRTVKTIVEISVAGRAPKNDPAIFALALATTFGDEATKNAAYKAITDVCRIGTHLFQFTENIQALRGWSRGLRNGVAKFYTQNDIDKVAMNIIKYRNRNNFTHRDVLRLCHASSNDAALNDLLRYAAGKEVTTKHALVQGFEEIQTLGAGDTKQAVALIQKYGLPREALPTELLNSREVWEALNQNMPMTATLRNLAKMTAVGLLKSNLDTNTKLVVERLNNAEQIKRSRVHPITILNALAIYKQGRGDKGSLTWSPVTNIIDALDEAFYTSFGNVETSGKNHLLALDCSGSMFGARIAGTGLTAAEAAGAMAMVTLKAEPNSEVVYFSSSGYGSSGIDRLDLSKRKRLDDVLKTMQKAPWGGTDCSLPMQWALAQKLHIDTFAIYTDNETYAGSMHPFQALNKYRSGMSVPEAKLITVGTCANGFTIADPSDKNMLDVVGFDTSTPQIMTEFSKGNL